MSKEGIRLLTLLPVLSIAIVLSSCNSEDNTIANIGSPQRLTFSVIDDDGWSKGFTRGEIENELSESIGIFAYGYNGTSWTGDSETPNIMYNEEVQGLQSAWMTTNAYSDIDFNPAEKGTNLRYFAYYPWQETANELLALSNETKQGYPEISYMVPNDVTKQADILAGQSDQKLLEDIRTPATIHMKHLMSAVRFVEGTIVEGTIKSITLRNVRTTGTYVIGQYADEYQAIVNAETAKDRSGAIDTEGKTEEEIMAEKDALIASDIATEASKLTSKDWKLANAYTDYSAKVEYKATNSTAQKVINPGEQTFIMLPQTLEAAQIVVTYEADQEYTFTFSLAGQAWKMGQVNTYRISVNSVMKMTLDTLISPWGEGVKLDGTISEGEVIVPDTWINPWGEGQFPDAITPDYATDWHNYDPMRSEP